MVIPARPVSRALLLKIPLVSERAALRLDLETNAPSGGGFYILGLLRNIGRDFTLDQQTTGEELRPVIGAADIINADSHIFKGRRKNVGSVFVGAHPRLHDVLGRALTAGDILTGVVIGHIGFIKRGEAGRSVGSDVVEFRRAFPRAENGDLVETVAQPDRLKSRGGASAVDLGRDPSGKNFEIAAAVIRRGKNHSRGMIWPHGIKDERGEENDCHRQDFFNQSYNLPR